MLRPLILLSTLVLSAFAFVPASARSPSPPAVPPGDGLEAGWSKALAGVTQHGWYTVDRTVPYAFRPIHQTATPLALGDDGEVTLPLPFTFRLFDREAAGIRISNNGGIRLGLPATELPAGNRALPDGLIGPAILPFWDDLAATAGNVYAEVQGEAPNRVAIIEWYQRPHFSTGVVSQQVSFQALLFERTHKIEFHYQDVEFGNALLDRGASATVGLGLDGTSAVVLGHNQATLTNASAVQFVPRRNYAFDREPFTYQSIHLTGTALNLGDDDEANLVLPFSFRFLGQESTRLRIANNGGILVGAVAGDLPVQHAPLPDGAIGPAILPLWTDLGDSSGNVYWQVFGQAPFRHVVIQWHERPHFAVAPTGTNRVNFQALLYESTGQIVFRYLDTQVGDPGVDFGKRATVGVNPGGIEGSALEHSFSQSVVQSGRSIVYTPLLVDYSDRARFDLEPLGHPCETFAETNLGPNQSTAFAAPLNAATSNAAFASSTIKRGLSFLDDPLNGAGGGSPLGLAFATAPHAGLARNVIAHNSEGDALVMQFAPPVNALGLYLHGTPSPMVDLQVFDQAGQLIAELDRPAPFSGRYLGFSSPRPVARVRAKAPPGANQVAVGGLCFALAPSVFRGGFE